MMWFHHVPWGHRMDNGRPFWDELVLRYQTGVQYVTWMRQAWDSLRERVDARRFAEVRAKLAAHEADAADWRDTSVGYWRQFSGRPIPSTDRSRSRSSSPGSGSAASTRRPPPTRSPSPPAHRRGSPG